MNSRCGTLTFLLVAGSTTLPSGAAHAAHSAHLPDVLARLEAARCPFGGVAVLSEPGRIPYGNEAHSPTGKILPKKEDAVTIEYGYEEEGAVLCQTRRSSLGILLKEGTWGWISSKSALRVISYLDLVKESLAFLTPASDGVLRDAPSDAAPLWSGKRPRVSASHPLEVDVYDAKSVEGVLWFHVGVKSHASCGEKEPVIVGKAWTKAYGTKPGARTSPAVWKFTRGC